MTKKTKKDATRVSRPWERRNMGVFQRNQLPRGDPNAGAMRLSLVAEPANAGVVADLLKLEIAGHQFCLPGLGQSGGKRIRV